MKKEATSEKTVSGQNPCTPAIAQADEQSRCGEAMTALRPSIAPRHRVVTNDGDCIAITADNGDRICTLKQGLLTTNSNGRLLAAAPELLEAAKEFVTRMDEVQRGLREWTTLSHAQELTLAVIAKAEGKS